MRTASNGREALEFCRNNAVDVALMDIRMPECDGVLGTKLIKACSPDTKVLILTTFQDSEYIQQSLNNGASGYLLKNCAFKELSQAIHIVAMNQIYISPQIAHIIVDESIALQPPSESSVQSILTPREREVLQLIAEGHTSKEIADILFVSLKTVVAHRSNIMGKLDLHNKAELIKYAIRRGLTSVDT